jgi:hypothetical protein
MHKLTQLLVIVLTALTFNTASAYDLYEPNTGDTSHRYTLSDLNKKAISADFQLAYTKEHQYDYMKITYDKLGLVEVQLSSSEHKDKVKSVFFEIYHNNVYCWQLGNKYIINGGEDGSITFSGVIQDGKKVYQVKLRDSDNKEYNCTITDAFYQDKEYEPKWVAAEEMKGYNFVALDFMKKLCKLLGYKFE